MFYDHFSARSLLAKLGRGNLSLPCYICRFYFQRVFSLGYCVFDLANFIDISSFTCIWTIMRNIQDTVIRMFQLSEASCDDIDLFSFVL